MTSAGQSLTTCLLLSFVTYAFSRPHSYDYRTHNIERQRGKFNHGRDGTSVQRFAVSDFLLPIKSCEFQVVF
ncbi:hypothetical protein ACET3Z_020131 [Daucus carota]